MTHTGIDIRSRLRAGDTTCTCTCQLPDAISTVTPSKTRVANTTPAVPAPVSTSKATITA